ncbi:MULTISPECIES: hypothetical protein [Niastella]|uniref:Uncharacterized protein n=1 Tax=Niastella soli TaxID=2821487 RepID=A0ABS3Z4Y8_9BACT|nr:hypothetical protein [Niastella soli]MBO9205238.1 hypothetical protein [Niastella soli]
MFYFKTITIPNTSPELIERAIRSYTVTRSSYFDFLITAGEDHDKKFFTGIERGDIFLITRLTNSDRLVGKKIINSWSKGGRTKIFVRFKKNNGFTTYQVRPGFSSIVLLCFFFFWLVIVARALSVSGSDFDLLFIILILLTVKTVIILKEIQITRKLINKAIQRTLDDDMLSSNIL